GLALTNALSYLSPSWSSPAPLELRFDAGTGRALSASNLFTWSGDADGYRDRINATAPEVIAAACDVPLPRMKRSSGPNTGEYQPPRAPAKHSDTISSSCIEPGTCRLITCVPGAAMSGCLMAP